MTSLAELALTPVQRAEVDEHDDALIDAWLTALTNAANVKNPAAWFIAGLRTGKPPHTDHDLERSRAIHLAETYIRNAGMFDPTEAEILDELFGPRGKLEPWAGDHQLRAQMAAYWQARQPIAEQVQCEQLERAERWKAANPTRTNHPVPAPAEPDADIPF